MIDKMLFGITKDGKNVDIYRLSNKCGNYVEILSYGCRIRGIYIKDSKDTLQNVCLHYDTLLDYEEDASFIGAAIGRFGNRIANGEFEIDGKQYFVTKNEKDNHLHGGKQYFGNVIWKMRIEGDKLICSRRFYDGEEGYPGDLDVEISYEFTDENRLIIQYEATTSKDTVINLTNHAYFNLSGDKRQSILDHEIMIMADCITPVDEKQIPTGEIGSVSQTPFDFTRLQTIGDCMDLDNEQLRIGKGYDINYAFGSSSMKKMAVLQCNKTGISMTCYSDQPGMQFYSGNNLDGDIDNKTGFKRYAALCLETQNYPDAVHHDNFPSPILRKNETYQTTTIYAFDTM